MVIDFSDDLGKKHFEFVFVGFILGGSIQSTKGMKVLRLEVGLFEKLESISDLKPCGKKLSNGEPARQLKESEPRQLQIDIHEFDLLYSYMSEVPWQAGTPAKMALETIDWLQKVSKNG